MELNLRLKSRNTFLLSLFLISAVAINNSQAESDQVDRCEIHTGLKSSETYTDLSVSDCIESAKKFGLKQEQTRIDAKMILGNRQVNAVIKIESHLPTLKTSPNFLESINECSTFATLGRVRLANEGTKTDGITPCLTKMFTELSSLESKKTNIQDVGFAYRDTDNHLIIGSIKL